jgi:hypothetical protein
MRKKKEYRFYTEEDGPEEAISFISIWDPVESEYLAQDAAEWLHDHYQFDVWPIVLTVESLDGKKIGKFSVSMEYVPQFSASELD